MKIAENLKQSLESKGIFLEVAGESLNLLGRLKRLTDAEKAQLVALKSEIIDLVRKTQAARKAAKPVPPPRLHDENWKPPEPASARPWQLCQVDETIQAVYQEDENAREWVQERFCIKVAEKERLNWQDEKAAWLAALQSEPLLGEFWREIEGQVMLCRGDSVYYVSKFIKNLPPINKHQKALAYTKAFADGYREPVPIGMALGVSNENRANYQANTMIRNF